MLNPIRVSRRAKCLTQRTLAKQLGVCRLTLVAWEVGRHAPHIESIPRIAKALDIPAEELARQMEAFYASLETRNAAAA